MIRQQFLLTAGEIREILHENDCILQINKTYCATDPCYAIGVFIFHLNYLYFKKINVTTVISSDARRIQFN